MLGNIQGDGHIIGRKSPPQHGRSRGTRTSLGNFWGQSDLGASFSPSSCAAETLARNPFAVRLDKYFRSVLPGATTIQTDELGQFRDELRRLLDRWRIAKTSSSFTVSGLLRCDSINLYIDHSSCARFALCEYPRVTTTTVGWNVIVLAEGDVGGVPRTTNGSGFVLYIENCSYSSSQATFTWERRGIP